MSQELKEDLILLWVQHNVALAPGQPQAESGIGMHRGHPLLPPRVPHPLPWPQHHVQASPLLRETGSLWGG